MFENNIKKIKVKKIKVFFMGIDETRSLEFCLVYISIGLAPSKNFYKARSE